MSGSLFWKVSNYFFPFESVLGKPIASSHLYILRVCKYFGYPKEQLTKLFDLLIMSLFLYGIEIWGAAYQGKYLYRIDKPLLEASVQIRIHQQPVCNSWSYQKSRL